MLVKTFRLVSVLILLTLLLSTLAVTPAHAAGIRYAKPAATGTGNCSSWANACTLQTALTGAVSGDEIWVAAGTHKPTTGTDRSATFQLKNGVAVYGGFAGTETARDQRDFGANITILSGDLKNDDIRFTNNDENVYHVVTGASGAILDGFTITAGNASGVSPNDRGGGMYNINDSSPTLANLIFYRNGAEDSGGGMHNSSSNPTLMNVTFNDNYSNEDGGGMSNYASDPIVTNVIFNDNFGYQGGGVTNAYSSFPTFTNVTFSNNRAPYGGGMFNHQSGPYLVNVVFKNNSAYADGGGMFDYSSYSGLVNVTFDGNLADDGGGMFIRSGSSTLRHVTFSGNWAENTGGGIYNEANNLTIRNTIFWNNTSPEGEPQIYNYNYIPTVSDSIVQGGFAGGTNIITADPMLGTLGDYGGFTQTVPLLAGSSAIDAGDDTVCPDTDQRGLTRPQGTHCDIGAYEYGETQTFNDVTVTHWAWDYVERLYAANITGGCGSSPRIYCPEKPVTRAQMAIFIERGMNGSAFTPSPASGTIFGDVAASYWAAAWVEQLASDNITGGCGNGNYCPDNPVTRAQMAVFLLKAMHGSNYLPPALGDSSGFGDVPTTYWAAAWVKQLAAEGITGGCGSGNYCPDQSVTRAQMAVFLVRAFNLP